MEEKGLTSAALAKKAELAPSLLSRLITENGSARRDPQIDHIFALARAFELPPAEFVVGTEAASVLDEWVPRDELEREIRTRHEAQLEASTLRTDLAGTEMEIQGLTRELDRMTQEAREAQERELTAQREQASLRVAKDSIEARLTIALQEREKALQLAQRNYEAWADAQAWISGLQRQVENAQGSAWITGLIGAGVGAVLANAANPRPGKDR
jgi:transcriptional regulator with XRE-family HTH domain